MKTSRTTEPTQDHLDRTRDQAHPECIICGHPTDDALGLRCQLQPDGSVVADLHPGTRFQGYPNRLHGGVISALLDGVMTNCLFAHDVVAYTAELLVRFRHPVASDEPVRLTARIERNSATLFVLRSQLAQNGQVRVTATGKFMKAPPAPDPSQTSR